ncbi:MAG TPA: hypothetical protein EYP78_05955 [Candidatus Omnitrophica bacterium]|nr:hypothetical protein [Candidatus Omnitrophota bacterium]
MEGTHHTHGAPLGELIIAESKAKEGFNPDETFQYRVHNRLIN